MSEDSRSLHRWFMTLAVLGTLNFVIFVLPATLAPILGNPRVSWWYTLYGICYMGTNLAYFAAAWKVRKDAPASPMLLRAAPLANAALALLVAAVTVSRIPDILERGGFVELILPLAFDGLQILFSWMLYAKAGKVLAAKPD